MSLDELEEVEVLSGDPASLIGMVRELTLAAWAMRGEPIPDYPRGALPGRLLRSGDEP